MSGNDSEKRQKVVKAFLSNNVVHRQNEIIKHLKGFECSQSTVHRDIIAAGYESTPEGYVRKESVAHKEKRELVERLLDYHSPKVGIVRDLTCTVIKAKVGTESSIASAIYDLYGDKFTGIFPGIGSIIILFRNEKSARKITKTLRDYANGISKYVPIIEEEQLIESDSETTNPNNNS